MGSAIPGRRQVEVEQPERLGMHLLMRRRRLGAEREKESSARRRKLRGDVSLSFSLSLLSFHSSIFLREDRVQVPRSAREGYLGKRRVACPAIRRRRGTRCRLCHHPPSLTGSPSPSLRHSSHCWPASRRTYFLLIACFPSSATSPDRLGRKAASCSSQGRGQEPRETKSFRSDEV